MSLIEEGSVEELCKGLDKSQFKTACDNTTYNRLSQALNKGLELKQKALDLQSNIRVSEASLLAKEIELNAEIKKLNDQVDQLRTEVAQAQQSLQSSENLSAEQQQQAAAEFSRLSQEKEQEILQLSGRLAILTNEKNQAEQNYNQQQDAYAAALRQIDQKLQDLSNTAQQLLD